MKIKVHPWIPGFIARRSRAEAVEYEPGKDWDGAVAICATAPTPAVPVWGAAAVYAPTGADTDPVILYAVEQTTKRQATPADPALWLGTLVARAVARVSQVDTILIAPNLARGERDRTTAAMTTTDHHQTAPSVKTFRSGTTKRHADAATAAYTMLRTGHLHMTRPELVDIPAGVRNGKPALADVDAGPRRLLEAAGTATRSALRLASVPVWVAVRPDGEQAQAWALRSRSTTIVCTICRSTEENCRHERVKNALKHCDTWGIDPDQSPLSGVSGVSRAT